MEDHGLMHLTLDGIAWLAMYDMVGRTNCLFGIKLQCLLGLFVVCVHIIMNFNLGEQWNKLIHRNMNLIRMVIEINKPLMET